MRPESNAPVWLASELPNSKANLLNDYAHLISRRSFPVWPRPSTQPIVADAATVCQREYCFFTGDGCWRMRLKSFEIVSHRPRLDSDGK
jgi:hypothetical protein